MRCSVASRRAAASRWNPLPPGEEKAAGCRAGTAPARAAWEEQHRRFPIPLGAARAERKEERGCRLLALPGVQVGAGRWPVSRAALHTSGHKFPGCGRRRRRIPQGSRPPIPVCAGPCACSLRCLSALVLLGAGERNSLAAKLGHGSLLACLQGAKGNWETSGLSAIFVAAFEKRFLQVERQLLSFKGAHQSLGGQGKVVLGRE